METTLVCPACSHSVRSPSHSSFFDHVASCVPPSASPLAPLFTPRLHSASNVACVGPTAASASAWPCPALSMAPSTPSTRAIVVRGAFAYALAASDADPVFTLPGGRALLLGSEAAARSAASLRALDVTSLINCAFNSEPLPPAELAAAGVAHVVKLEFRDEAAAPGQDNGALIRAGVAGVAAGVASTPGAVLVHCVAGVSRSASVVAAYLVAHHGLSLADAMARVKRARPVAHPNAGFWRALVNIEREARGSAGSVTLKDVEALHRGDAYPVSTHVFGAAERS
jgi:atypical dual specificity phosphatase